MMKYFIPYMAIIILFGTACDNYEISSKQTETFVRYYGVGLEDEGMQVITTDQGYLIMANVKNPGRGKDICIITTDKSGNTTAPVAFYGDIFDDIGYTIKPYNEGYIIAGSTQVPPNEDKDVYFFQLNSDGSFKSDKPPEHIINNQEAYDVLVEDDGDLVFTGYTEYSQSGESTQQRDILFYKYSPSRDTTIFDRKGILVEDEEAYSIELAYDSTYLFAGYRTDNGIKKIYILRWNGKTSTVDIRIPTDGNSEARCIINTHIKDTYNDDIFLVSCNNESATNQSKILLMETDYTLREDSTTILNNLGERSINSVQSMTLLGNTLYICGTSSSGEQEYGDMMLIQLTADGSNPLYYYFGDGISYRGNGFDFTRENGYVITGASYLNEKSMITLFKVNSEGTL